MKKLFSFLLVIASFTTFAQKPAAIGFAHPWEYKHSDLSNVPAPVYATDLQKIQSGNYHCIWLDFDGGFVSGTLWNTAYSNPFITYGPTTFVNNADSVNFIVNYTREKYKPFKVVVTKDSTLFFLTPQGRRSKVIVTPTDDWLGSFVGGISYYGTITWPIETPSWAFQIANSGGDTLYNLRTIGDVATHEAGHQYNLKHQSLYNGATLVNTYHPGYGTNDSSFAPIMGRPYDSKASIWWSGKNESGVLQDDIGLFTSGWTGMNVASNLKLEDDDIGNLWQNAKYVEIGSTYNYIQTTLKDSDFYKFVLPRDSLVKLSVTPFIEGLDSTFSAALLDVFLLNENRLVLWQSAGIGKGAYLTANLKSGVYYVMIKPRKRIYYNATGYGFSGSYSIRVHY